MHIQQNGGAYTNLCMPHRLIMVPPARLELTAHGLGNYGTPKNTPDTTENCYQQSQPKHLNTGQNTTQNDPDNVPPVALTPIFENIPVQLQAIPNWVVWRYEQNQKTRKWNKVPYVPGTTRKASTTTPSHWTTFSQAKACYLERPDFFSGIGFVFTLEAAIIGIDFDACYEGGQLNQFASNLLPDSYTEISPSGTGIKSFVYGKINSDRKTPQVEIYAEKRFFTITGHILNNATIRHQQPAVDKIISSLPETKLNTNSSTAHGSRYELAQRIPEQDWKEARFIMLSPTLKEQLRTRLQRATREDTQLGLLLAKRYVELNKCKGLTGLIFRADSTVDDSMLRSVAANGIKTRGFTFSEYVVLMSTLFSPNKSKELWRQELASLWFKSRSPKRPPLKRTYMPPAPKSGRGGSQETTVQRVYQYLLEHKTGVSALVTREEIATELNCVKRTVSMALAKLREDGKITTKRLNYALVVTFPEVIETPVSEVIETQTQTVEIQQNEAVKTVSLETPIEETEETTTRTEKQTVYLQVQGDQLSLLREAEKCYGTNRQAIEFHIAANSELSQAQQRELMAYWDYKRSEKWRKTEANVMAKATKMSRTELRNKAKSAGSYAAQLRHQGKRQWVIWNLMACVYESELNKRDRQDNEAALARQANQAKPQKRYDGFLGYSSWEISEMMWLAEKELAKLNHNKTAVAVQLEA